jgi:ATP-dependent Clp protease ATP-binding subunit ClpA
MSQVEFDAASRQAIELAKSALPEGKPLDVDDLLPALYHAARLGERWPELGPYLPAPERRHPAPDKVPLSEALRPILNQLARDGPRVTAEGLFAALLRSDPGHQILNQRGLSDDVWQALVATAAGPAPGRREPLDREQAMRALGQYGRMLTAVDLPDRGTAEMDAAIERVVRSLTRMRSRNVIILGYSGTGKSALVYELARRLRRRDESIPPALRDWDIFELSPTFLRSGASMVGQFEERVKGLLQVLQAHPKVALFIDEIHSFFQSGRHERGPFTDANEGFKGALARGEITVIGCTTQAEYRAAIEPDPALARRFDVVRLEPPSAEATLRILQARRPKMEEHFAPLRIPEALLPRIVALTEAYLPARFQPEKSLRLLDGACSFCVTARPPAEEVREEHLLQALEDLVGHPIVRRQPLTEADVFRELSARIIGHERLLGELAAKFVAGLGSWEQRPGPRGVFLFGGPTGVGKTETAVALARILGGGREHLVRVDCNVLQGSGTGQESNPLTWKLLGVPPGYLGYVRGESGLLGRVRDLPESVVLFDEFEKADRTVGQLLLRILDEGRVEDSEGDLSISAGPSSSSPPTPAAGTSRRGASASTPAAPTRPGSRSARSRSGKTSRPSAWAGSSGRGSARGSSSRSSAARSSARSSSGSSTRCGRRRPSAACSSIGTRPWSGTWPSSGTRPWASAT